MSAGLENGGSVGKSEGHGDIMDEDCGGEEGHVFNDDQANSRGVNGLGGSHDRRGGEEGRPPQKRARDAKYAIPTMEEACLLRETEGNLFEGNVLRLEVEELLGEVRVDYGKRTVKALEVWLHTLKDALEDLPPSTVTEDSLDLEGIRLANHVPGKPVTLDFRPPETDGFDVAGSFLLRALAKPSLNVDLSLRMPSSCLVPRDALNHRYLDKRALYAGHLAAAAMDKEGRLGKLVDKVEVSYFKGDPRKPVVLLHPSLGGAVSKRFTVRLLPCCGKDIMAHARLGPRRNNVRTRSALAQLASMENGEGGATDSTAGDNIVAGGSVRGEEVVSSLPATPRYNSAVLEDMCIKSHLAALHGLCRDSQAFRDAIILGKVWLGQHGMRTSHDSLGGYEWSMLLLHLAQSRRVNARMPALSIFQVALKFIADGGLSRDCLTVHATAPSENHGHEGQALPLTPQEGEAFKEAFPAVMVDTSLGFNVLARISSSAVEELEMTAKASVSLFQGRPGAAFPRLFMTRTTLWRKCDAFVQIPLVPAKRGREEEEGLLDRPLWSHVAQRVTELLREGLGDRCVLARPLCGAAGEATEDFQGVPGPRGWHPRSPPPPEGCFAHPSGGGVGGKRNREDLPRLTVGLIVDPTFAGRLVDKGPPAEDGPAARKFREFWGEKSELRRFKDGSIVEAVVWTGKGAQRHRVVEQIVRHVLARHDSSRCAKSSKMPGQGVRFRGNELLGMVAAAGTKGATEDDDLTRIAMRELDKLQERAKAIDGMPLRVEALQAASPSLRYTSLLPPAPHPLATSHGETRPSVLFESGPSKPKKITSQVEPLEVVVRLEGSGKWPDEPEAVRSTETAFLIRLAQCLETKYKLKCVVARRYLDVVTGGYCFRLRIGGDRALQLQLRSQNKGVNHNTIDLESLALREEGVLAAPHHSGMHGLHLQKPAFGLTVRAALRWLEEHMMSDHLRVEAVELLVASLFSDDGFSCWAGLASPSTTLVGFLRFLLLLSGHDWETAPLVVDPQGELTASDRAAAEEAFTRSRDRDPGGGDAMFIVAPYSRDFGWSSSWTRPRPERPLLGRLVALAKASAESLVEWLAGEGVLGRNPAGWKKAFRMTKEEEQTFDVTLSLNKAFVCDSSSSDPSGSAVDPSETAKAKAKAERQELSGSETFERRRIRGCPALQTPAYKNLLSLDRGAKKAAKDGSEFAAHGSVVVGFDPIGDLVSEFRRRFGHLAVFFSPGPAGSTGKIGVIWRPSAFLPRPYNVTRSRYTMAVSAETVSGEDKGKGKGGAMTVLGIVEVLAEIKGLAGDMLDGIHLS